MKVREVMTPDPVCCVPSDTAQKVAQVLRDENVGSLPVVVDRQSLKLIGMITDRDICCSMVAYGLDPKKTTIEIVSCRDGENLDKCERAMQEHQLRRIPVVDGDGRCIGIVSQADLALKDKAEKVSKTVAEISKLQGPSIAA
ncbi:MAG TPA: CBS domain-containing protein [Candidatus Angelobacter sp.]|jgi:CBS domain-containing protein